jgi:hypothetical protein
MFVNEFFFSFSLLAFALVLMVGGVFLVVDASRRLVKDGYRRLQQTQVAVKLAVPRKPPEKITTSEQAA